MEFVAATNNQNKLRELASLLEGSGHTVVSLAEAGLSIQPAETGETFAENALIKARAAAKAAGKPALADDSGLEVDALGGDPGVHSARFAGNEATDEENNQKLMRLLERFPYAKRGAHFKSAVVLVTPEGRELVAEGGCDGMIGFAASGENGFGYDPLFYVNGKSFADMTDEEKNAISHRAAAVKAFLRMLPDFLAGKAPAAPAAPAPEQPAGEAPPAEGGQ